MSNAPATTPAGGAAGPRPRYKRKLSNYLLDKKLQLRYVLIVTILSGMIAGILGFMIYQQRRAGAESIDANMTTTVEYFRSKANDATLAPEQREQALASVKTTLDQQRQAKADFAREDRVLVYKMVAVGVGLVIILSLYLLIMTHKVAGPLFKTSMYFDRMADKKLSKVTPLRQGDMLQDFFSNFKEMHEAVRARAIADNDAMARAVETLTAAKNKGDYRGEGHDKLTEAVEAMAAHVEQRKKNLVDFPKSG